MDNSKKNLEENYKNSKPLKNFMRVYLSNSIHVFFPRSTQTTISIFFLCFVVLYFAFTFTFKSFALFPLFHFFQYYVSKNHVIWIKDDGFVYVN